MKFDGWYIPRSGTSKNKAKIRNLYEIYMITLYLPKFRVLRKAKVSSVRVVFSLVTQFRYVLAVF